MSNRIDDLIQRLIEAECFEFMVDCKNAERIIRQWDEERDAEMERMADEIIANQEADPETHPTPQPVAGDISDETLPLMPTEHYSIPTVAVDVRERVAEEIYNWVMDLYDDCTRWNETSEESKFYTRKEADRIIALFASAPREPSGDVRELLQSICDWHEQFTKLPTPLCIAKARNFIKRNLVSAESESEWLEKRKAFVDGAKYGAQEYEVNEIFFVQWAEDEAARRYFISAAPRDESKEGRR